MRKTFLGVWIIAVTVLTMFVWLTKTTQGNKHTYYTSVISDSDSPNFINMHGKILIKNETTLVPASEGSVVKVNVRPGDKVKKDQVLALLDIQPEDLAIHEQLRSVVMDAGPLQRLNSSLEEINRLEIKGFYSVIEASKKRGEIYSNLSQLMSYRANLQKQFEQTYGKIIRAPFDGYVSEVRLREGQRVSTRDDNIDISIAVVPFDSSIEVELEVSDEFLNKVSIGQSIRVSIPLTTEISFSGKISSVSKQVYDDKRKRFFKVIGSITTDEKSRAKLSSGMRIIAEVTSEKEQKWVWIPKAALDINIDDSKVSSKLNFVVPQHSHTASTKGSNFHSSKNSEVDVKRDPSSVLSKASNEVFPDESKVTEVFLLTVDNKVIKATIQKVAESGDMFAVDTKKLVGMRVITHYKDNGFLW